MVRLAAEICRVGPAQHRDSSSEVALLLDGLIARFDLAKDHYQVPDTVKKEAPPVNATYFARFLDLPTEIQKIIFSFSSTPYMAKLYSEDRKKINDWRAAFSLQAVQQLREQGHLASRLMNTQAPSRVIFVNYRSVRTVPLLHTCRTSRELAISRYGLPSPTRLLFDPSIDSVRHCGQWPYSATPRLHLVFAAREQHFCDFSQIKSLQLHIPGFSTGTGLCLPPDFLLNSIWPNDFRPVNPVSYIRADSTSTTGNHSTVNSTIDLAHALSWIESYIPQLEELIFTIPLTTWDESSVIDYSEALTDERGLNMVDLINIRTCFVMLEELKSQNNEAAYLPQLSSLAIQLVQDDRPTEFTPPSHSPLTLS